MAAFEATSRSGHPNVTQTVASSHQVNGFPHPLLNPLAGAIFPTCIVIGYNMLGMVAMVTDHPSEIEELRK